MLAAAGNQFFSQTLSSTCNLTSSGHTSDNINDGDLLDHLHLPEYTATQVKELVLLSYGLVFNLSEENSKYTSGDESGTNVNPLFPLLIVDTKRENVKVDWKSEETFYEEEYYPYQMTNDEGILNPDDYHISQQDHMLSEMKMEGEDNIEMGIKKRKKLSSKKNKKKVSSIKHKKKKLLKTEMMEDDYPLLPIDKFEDDEEGQFTCHVCGLEFNKREALNYHLKRNHENPEGFKCPKCPRMLKSESGLKYHMNIHDGFTFSCHMCPKVLKSKHGLAYHMNIHNSSQAFLCNDCGKSFVTKQKLQNHVRAKHTMERPYVCDTCGSGFVRSDKLLIHKRRVHTGERPYSCEHCDWKGVDSSDLIHHRKKHLKNLPTPQKTEPMSFIEHQQQ